MKSDILELNQQYAEILVSLARGIDPVTEKTIDTSTLNRADIVRALCAGAVALRTSKVQEISDRKTPNAGKHWSAQDDAILLEAFRNGEPIEMIAYDFGRSPLAIYMRLDKLLRKHDSKTIKNAMQNRKIR